MRVCWFGIYSPDYPRNAILRKGLTARGVSIIDCRVPSDDAHRHRNLIRQLRDLRGKYDLIYVAYPAPSVALWARLFGSGPVVVDAFYSMYDAVVNDRKEISWFHPRAWKLAILDFISIIVADLVITDTSSHAAYWMTWPLLSRARYLTVPIGVDPALFYPRAPRTADGVFEVLFFGSYIPLHGIERVLDAASILRDDAFVRFVLIGRGQEYKKAVDIIRMQNLHNVRLIDCWVPQKDIPTHIATCDASLGIFGTTRKASRVVPNKLYEALAMRKPVITMDSPAMREFFDPKDIVLVEGDGESLAKAIRYLAADTGDAARVAGDGYRAVAAFIPEKLADMLIPAFRDMMGRHK